MNNWQNGKEKQPLSNNVPIPMKALTLLLIFLSPLAMAEVWQGPRTPWGDPDLQAGKFVGGYNSAWLDPGAHLLRVKGEPRTSIIVDPPDGKVPYTMTGKFKLLWAIVNSQKSETILRSN
jgi:hypothetical protein